VISDRAPCTYRNYNINVVQQNSFKPATDTLPDCPETEEDNPRTGSSAIDDMQYVY